jgi:O-antigen/teichoic acid export membrane protein
MVCHIAIGYATLWLTALIDVRMTAVLAACLSIVGLANPVVQGLYNILAPQAVLAWQSEGIAGLVRKVWRDLALLAAVMTAFCIVIVLAAESAIQLLYPAAQYGGYGHVVYILAFAASAAALGMPASNGLATMGKARAAAGITVATALLHCVLVTLAMCEYGLIGAAYASLASTALWTTARWSALLHFAGRQVSSPALKR